jgi:hypothetical protein
MEMGIRRTGHRTLGIAAMSGPLARAALALGLAAAVLSAGCSSIGGFTGAIAGVAAGSVSSNPAVGVGIGVAVQAATDEAIATVFRHMQRDEQDRIAMLAGTMRIGDKQPWDIHHLMPFSDEHGELQVVRDIDTPLAQCREILFSVISGKPDKGAQESADNKSATSKPVAYKPDAGKAAAKHPPLRFITQTCRRPDGTWKWAAAEPAVERWGTLQ